MDDCQNRTVNGTELTSDYLVTRLRSIPTAQLANAAADEIERLCEAGDALAEALRVNQGRGAASAFMAHRALTGWEEARRD